MFGFEEVKKLKNNLGRAGVLRTPHGDIKTPAFSAVGTKATVKSVTPEMVESIGSQVVLANTYHLYLEPGENIIKAHGGLHEFMNWHGPIMTDSGGFQAFSLGVAYGQGINKFIGAETPDESVLEIGYSETNEKKAKVTENGVEFKSVIDGSKHFFSPEKSMQIQHDLGADIIFAFDECTSPHATKEYLREAMERTHRWAERSLREHKKIESSVEVMSGEQLSERDRREKEDHFQQKKNPFAREMLPPKTAFPKSLFGIVQGGRHEDLRRESAEFIGKMDFDGFGIGGSFVKEDMANAVRWVNEVLPEKKPRHLLGVAEPIDLFLGVENGCDTFDCVAATRMSRNGAIYTKEGRRNIRNAEFRADLAPLEEGCDCYTCQNYTRSYVAHLFRANEMLAATLATIHNIRFINCLMEDIRSSILEERFDEFKDSFLTRYFSRKRE